MDTLDTIKHKGSWVFWVVSSVARTIEALNNLLEACKKWDMVPTKLSRCENERHALSPNTRADLDADSPRSLSGNRYAG